MLDKQQLIETLAGQPIGSVLEIATSEYADNHTQDGYHFFAHANASAVRALVTEGIAEVEYMYLYYNVKIVREVTDNAS